MTKPQNEIHSISDLIRILDDLQPPERGKTRFFRGHADESWQLVPSIYRERYLIENEDKIIKDALTNCPDDFSPEDTLFEKLVKLQHYGYKTRLLDLTANALVALFFACWNDKHQDKAGELIVLDIENNNIKYSDSDTVAILSAISIQSEKFELNSSIEEANISRILTGIEYPLKNKEILLGYNQYRLGAQSFGCEAISEEEYIKTFLSEKEELEKESFRKKFNEQKNIISLLHDIRTDKPSFYSDIDYRDLYKVLCVRAKLNNARISRQQGCFLLFGMENKKIDHAIMPIEWLRKPQDGKKFIIKNKEKIIKELKSFGISSGTLFPELERQADEIISQYCER